PALPPWSSPHRQVRARQPRRVRFAHGRRPANRREARGADENAAIMRRAYEAFNSGDMDTLVELFDESAVWHTPGRSWPSNEYQGREATLAYFGRLGQETGGTFQAELQQDLLADDDGHVIGIQ